jgi:sugar phosphate isomerase/epimerase
MKIGLRLESLGLPLRRALTTAAQLGIGGVQVDALGDLAPERLSQTGRREFRHRLRSHNLELTAVGCPMRRGLNVAEDLEARIAHVREVMKLAADLGPRIVIVEAGRIAADASAPANALLREALVTLGRHGDHIGAILALETGQEAGEVLASFLDRLDTGGLGANFDPANLLIQGFDPYTAIAALNRRIVHAHAKDARTASASRSAAEVALGHGDLDWMRLVALLEEADYRGWLTVERETGERKQADVAEGVAFLRRFVRQLS